jgi:hypothetical protein
MNCNFVGSTCTESSPCCDGFNCNTAGICDFYEFNANKNCPAGYSKVYTTDNAGLCALDIQKQGGWVIWLVIIIFCVVVLSLIIYTVYKLIKHKRVTSP